MLVILQGIPGLGKTTLAKEYCSNKPNSVYLEQDSFNGNKNKA